MPMMFFYFLKIIFDISISKRFKRYKPHSILAKKKKKNLKFAEKQVEQQSQTLSHPLLLVVFASELSSQLYHLLFLVWTS
jgi:uncharacterized ion transporter superfamily protein YfcC